MASFLLASGWLVLDVTRAVRLWQKDYRTNQGLMVEITEIGTGHQVNFAQNLRISSCIYQEYKY